MPIRLAFHGAASTPTGTCLLIEHAAGRLLVDCGLFEGTATVRKLNRRTLPFSPLGIDGVLLTHAHLDHAGLLPELVRAGFKGPVMATEPTCDLLGLLLSDLAERAREDALREDRRSRRAGLPPVEPLFRRSDALRVLERLERCDYGRWFEPAAGVRARLWNSGHLPGSAAIELEIEDGAEGPVRLLVSGDLGPDLRAAEAGPSSPGGVDHLVLACPEGDREREEIGPGQRRERLAREVRTALEAGGPLLIPALGAENTVELVHALLESAACGAIPEVPIFLDAPMAVRAVELFARYRGAAGERGRVAGLERLRPVAAIEQSEALERLEEPAIVVAAGGMCEGGRIRRHLLQHLWRPTTTLLLVGYQAPGTLGQILLSGERRVRIDGEEVAVKGRIRAIDSVAGHADRRELAAWVEARRPITGGIFLIRGEERASLAVKSALAAIGLDPLAVIVPHLDQRFELAPARPPVPLPGPVRIEPRVAAMPADWHNAHARLLLDIADELRTLPDDRSRLELLGRLRRTLRS